MDMIDPDNSKLKIGKKRMIDTKSSATLRNINLGVYDIWALGITIVIGGQYFGWNAGLSAGFGSFAIATLLIATGYYALILCIAELASALPFAGGSYGVTRVMIGIFPGYIVGCCDNLESIVYVSVSFQTLAVMIISMTNQSEIWQPIYCLAFYATSLTIHIHGGTVFWRVNTAVALVSTLILIIYILGSAQYANFDKYAPDQSYHDSNTNDIESKWFHGGAYRFISILPYPCWLFVGVELINIACHDINKPKIIVPRAYLYTMHTLFLTGVSVVLVCCSLYPGVYQLANNLNPLNGGLERMFQLSTSASSNYVTILSLPAVYSTAFGFMFCYGRQIRAMASSGLFHPYFSTCNFTKNHTPVPALLLGSFIGYALCILVYFIPSIQAQLFNISMLGAFVAYFSQFASFLIFRRLFTNIKREFISPLGTPAAIYGISVFLLVFISIAGFQVDQISIIAFVAYLCVASVYYYFVVRHRQFFSDEEQEILFGVHVLKNNMARNELRKKGGGKRSIAMKKAQSQRKLNGGNMSRSNSSASLIRGSSIKSNGGNNVFHHDDYNEEDNDDGGGGAKDSYINSTNTDNVNTTTATDTNTTTTTTMLSNQVWLPGSSQKNYITNVVESNDNYVVADDVIDNSDCEKIESVSGNITIQNESTSIKNNGSNIFNLLVKISSGSAFGADATTSNGINHLTSPLSSASSSKQQHHQSNYPLSPQSNRKRLFPSLYSPSQSIDTNDNIDAKSNNKGDNIGTITNNTTATTTTAVRNSNIFNLLVKISSGTTFGADATTSNGINHLTSPLSSASSSKQQHHQSNYPLSPQSNRKRLFPSLYSPSQSIDTNDNIDAVKTAAMGGTGEYAGLAEQQLLVWRQQQMKMQQQPSTTTTTTILPVLPMFTTETTIDPNMVIDYVPISPRNYNNTSFNSSNMDSSDHNNSNSAGNSQGSGLSSDRLRLDSDNDESKCGGDSSTIGYDKLALSAHAMALYEASRLGSINNTTTNITDSKDKNNSSNLINDSNNNNHDIGGAAIDDAISTKTTFMHDSNIATGAYINNNNNNSNNSSNNTTATTAAVSKFYPIETVSTTADVKEIEEEEDVVVSSGVRRLSRMSSYLLTQPSFRSVTRNSFTRQSFESRVLFLAVTESQRNLNSFLADTTTTDSIMNVDEEDGRTAASIAAAAIDYVNNYNILEDLT